MKGKDDFGGNLFVTECPTLAHYQATPKLLALRGGRARGGFPASPGDPADSKVFEVSVAQRDGVWRLWQTP